MGNYPLKTSMGYNIISFHETFPDTEACLECLFRLRYPGQTGWYKVRNRMCYADAQGRQLYPMKGTIFEKSDTPLVKWFYALYLFSTHKNGVPAKTLERELKVTYKTAWRMARQIRTLMHETGKLSGIIEADETQLGHVKGAEKKRAMVVGALSRTGQVRTKAIADKSEFSIVPFMESTIRKGSTVITDSGGAYRTMRKFNHVAINKAKEGYARGMIHTNSIEGFWSKFKRSVHGSYHSISEKHLQSYLDEFSFRYNHRKEPMFEKLLERI